MSRLVKKGHGPLKFPVARRLRHLSFEKLLLLAPACHLSVRFSTREHSQLRRASPVKLPWTIVQYANIPSSLINDKNPKMLLLLLDVKYAKGNE